MGMLRGVRKPPREIVQSVIRVGEGPWPKDWSKAKPLLDELKKFKTSEGHAQSED